MSNKILDALDKLHEQLIIDGELHPFDILNVLTLLAQRDTAQPQQLPEHAQQEQSLR